MYNLKFLRVILGSGYKSYWAVTHATTIMSIFFMQPASTN